jgi:hypothetical protein
MELIKPHRGVGLGFVSELNSGQKKITALYYDQKSLALHEYGNNFNLVKNIPVSFPANRGNLAVGDFDGDGSYDYAVGAPAGVSARLGYYSRTGQEKRLFYPYSSYSGGFALSTVDLNSDNKDEVVLSPYQSTAPVRVWNGKGKMVEEWTVEKSEGINGLKILVY